MRTWLAVVLLAGGCGTDTDPNAERGYTFGPFELAAGQEDTSHCVSATLHNDLPLYVNAVEVTGAPGIHHSNWFWVKDTLYAGPDGIFTCDDRAYSDAAAGVFGGVVFAQSTQATHELQRFQPGTVIVIPPHSKLVASVHLLNSSDGAERVPLSIALTPIAPETVQTKLAGMTLQNQSIALPPRTVSRFALECDLSKTAVPHPTNFSLYYILPHFHALGTGLKLEALRDSDGGADLVWDTESRIGDALGGPLPAPFSLAGHSRMRLTCTFDNPRDQTVRWGNGDQEMCMFLGFTDSPFTWGGGINAPEDPGPGVAGSDGAMQFTSSACQVLTADANR